MTGAWNTLEWKLLTEKEAALFVWRKLLLHVFYLVT